MIIRCSTICLLFVYLTATSAVELPISFADPVASIGAVTGSLDGITVVIDVVAGGSAAVLDGNASGVGVNSDLDSGTAATQRRVDGTLSTPETVTLTLSGFTEQLSLNGFLLGSMGNDETATFSSSAFDGVTGYTSIGFSFDDTTDTISYNKTASEGLTDLVFPGAEIPISSGDQIVFSTSLAEGGGVLLDEIRLELPIADLTTTVIPTFPTNTIMANPYTGSGGSTVIAADNSKAQPFSLVAASTVTSFVFQVEEVMTSVNLAGGYTLEVFPTMNNFPWLAPVFSGDGFLPGGITMGDVFRIDLATPLALKRGSYAVSVSTRDADFRLKLTDGDAYPHGIAIRNNASSGNSWQLGAQLDNDLVFAVLGSQAVSNSPPARPNIVFILADDLGWTDVQAGASGPNVVDGQNYGSDFYQTPNLKRLAERGVSFTSCYMHQNCAPTRAALLTGQYPARSGNGVYNVSGLNRGDGGESLVVPQQNQDVPESSITYAERLQLAGYITAHFGKYHVGNHEGGEATMPENQGYDFNFGGQEDGSPGSYTANGTVFGGSIGPGLDAWAADYSQAYVDDVLKGPAHDPLHTRADDPNAPSVLVGERKQTTDAIGDAFIDFVRDHQQGALAAHPFFAQVHTYAVHTPIQPRADLQSKYVPLPDGTYHQANAYAGLLEGFDQTVGRILDFLDDPNADGDFSDAIASNTVVIFTSDNGGHEGDTDNAPLRNRKGSFYDGGLRVPLMVRYLGKTPEATRTDSLVHAVDFYPTILEFAGTAAPDPGSHKLDGFSFAAHALAPIQSVRNRDPIFYHFPGYLDNRSRPCTVCIKRVGGIDYKLIYNYDMTYTGNNPQSDAMPVLSQPWELYCLAEDLSESTNLLGDSYSNWLLYGSIADDMAAEARAWITQSGDDWQPRQNTLSGGAPVAFLPADVPDVAGADFRIVERAFDTDTGIRTLAWRGEAGFLYEIQGSNNLKDWEVLETGIRADSEEVEGSTVDTSLIDDDHQYYRVRLYRDFQVD
jgi:arylsulfatase A-like enzyme